MLERISTKISPRFLPVLIVAGSCAAIGLVFFLAYMMRPVADDYAYFSDPLIHNPFKFALHYYMDWTGRSGQAFWASILYTIFGNHVTQYGTILQLILLVIAACALIYVIFYRHNKSHIQLISLSLLVVTICLFMSPSLIDAQLWLTSSSVYVGSLVSALFSITFVIYLLRKQRVTIWHYIALFFTTFIAQLFSEPTSLILIYLGLLASFVCWFYYHNRKATITAVLYSIAATAGFLYMYLSPGTRIRQAYSHVHTSFWNILTGALGDMTKLDYIFTSYRIVLVGILCGILVLFFIKLSRKNALLLANASFLSCLVIPYVLFLVTRYTMGEYIPFRAYTVPVTLAAVFLATGIAALSSFFPQTRTRMSVASLSILVTLALPFSLIALLKTELPVIYAVTIRSQAYDTREISIHEQVTRGTPSVLVTPLPILYTKTDALDFGYATASPAWLEQSFKNYYHIPANTKVTYRTQPLGYCTLLDNPSWIGAKNCLEQSAETP